MACEDELIAATPAAGLRPSSRNRRRAGPELRRPEARP